MKDRKVITGYAALIDPASADRALLIFIEVLLDRTTGDVFDAPSPTPCAASPRCWSAIWWPAATTI